MHSFEHNYLIYDEFGEKEILCMSCGGMIKSRQEIISKRNPEIIIREMSKHADYKEIPAKFSDGSLTFIMVCDNCKFVDLNTEICQKIDLQIRNALKAQLEWHGKTEDVVNEILNRIQRKIIGRAETSEIANAMKGII